MSRLYAIWLRVFTACLPFVYDKKSEDAFVKQLLNRGRGGKV